MRLWLAILVSLSACDERPIDVGAAPAPSAAPCVDYMCPLGDKTCTCHGGTTERVTPLGRACECPAVKLGIDVPQGGR